MVLSEGLLREGLRGVRGVKQHSNINILCAYQYYGSVYFFVQPSIFDKISEVN